MLGTHVGSKRCGLHGRANYLSIPYWVLHVSNMFYLLLLWRFLELPGDVFLEPHIRNTYHTSQLSEHVDRDTLSLSLPPLSRVAASDGGWLSRVSRVKKRMVSVASGCLETGRT